MFAYQLLFYHQVRTQTRNNIAAHCLRTRRACVIKEDAVAFGHCWQGVVGAFTVCLSVRSVYEFDVYSVLVSASDHNPPWPWHKRGAIANRSQVSGFTQCMEPNTCAPHPHLHNTYTRTYTTPTQHLQNTYTRTYTHTQRTIFCCTMPPQSPAFCSEALTCAAVRSLPLVAMSE